MKSMVIFALKKKRETEQRWIIYFGASQVGLLAFFILVLPHL